MMSLEQIRLAQNPVLTNLLLGMGQGEMIAERVLPRLPQALRGHTVPVLGKERLTRIDTRRAPGSLTRRVDISWKGKVFTVDQHSVEVPIPREMIEETDTARRFNVGAHLDVSTIAVQTASDILALDYEAEAAATVRDESLYAASNKQALSGAAKWNADGDPVADVRAAADVLRSQNGVRPNTLTVSASVYAALQLNAKIRAMLPGNQLRLPDDEQLRALFGVQQIIVGNAIWVDADEKPHDVWGDTALLSYTGSAATFSLASPAFGYTSVMEGHPFVEQPYYNAERKSWIYGATFERAPQIANADAGFLFVTPI